MNDIIIILLAILITVNVGTLISMGLLISFLQNLFDNEDEGEIK